MKRPQLFPENSQEIYQYYEQRVVERAEKTRNAALSFARFVSKIMNISVEINPTNRAIMNSAIQSEDASLIVALNHISEWDFPALGALVDREEDLLPVVDDCFILAKVGLMKLPYRPLVEGLGGVPVFRSKDGAGDDRRQAVQHMFDMSSRLLAAGYPMVIFPEGGLFPEQERMGKIERGIGAIAMKARQLGQEDVRILPIGLAYGRSYRHAQVSIGRVFQAANSEQSIVSQTEHYLNLQRQEAFNLAQSQQIAA